MLYTKYCRYVWISHATPNSTMIQVDFFVSHLSSHNQREYILVLFQLNSDRLTMTEHSAKLFYLSRVQAYRNSSSLSLQLCAFSLSLTVSFTHTQTYEHTIFGVHAWFCLYVAALIQRNERIRYACPRERYNRFIQWRSVIASL